jgi:hypothetical protein
MKHTIGKCIGCLKMGQLEDGVGKCCLSHPSRGKEWAIAANKVRNDPESAKKVWKYLPSDDAKRLFIYMFGLPPGERHPDFKLSVVK